MEKILDLSGKLDFSEIDMTAPDIVIAEILSQLPGETHGHIMGKISAYDGHIMSYTAKGISSLSIALGTKDREVDIQEELGKLGTEANKFECYLYTPEYEKYKYRMFFMRYNVSNYPVTIVLDNSVSESISGVNSGYIYTCNTRSELEELMIRILTSKRIIGVMQELIRVSQSKKMEEKRESED